MWQNRVTGHGEEAPDQLLANPLNPRRHPGEQRDALRAAIAAVGYLSPVIVNRTTGHVVDGHLRIEEALRAGVTAIPVTYVTLTEEEERLALATFDPIGGLAAVDREAMTALLEDTTTAEPALMELMEAIAEAAGVIPVDGDDRTPAQSGQEPDMVVCPSCGCEFER